MAMNENSFHVAIFVRDLESAVERYRQILGIEPAKVRRDYAKFELEDPPVVLSLNVGGEPGKLSHMGIRYTGSGELATERVRAKNENVEMLEQPNATCCYARGEKFWVSDADGVPWEMYALLEENVEAETAADAELRGFLGQ